jgi:hypothetical protein
MRAARDGRTARKVTTLAIVVSCLGAVWACSDSAAPLGSGDKLVNDTAGMDANSQPPPPPPPGDGAADGADGYGYAPALNTCGSCSCDPTKNYCMSGGTRVKGRTSYPYGGFGEPDGAPTGPPPAPCKVLDAGAQGNGCIPLPAACATTPTCDCLVNTLQPMYACYLVCSPTPGFLEVYCPDAP